MRLVADESCDFSVVVGVRSAGHDVVSITETMSGVADLKRKLVRYIRHYNKSPRTVKWRYTDPSRHIRTESVVIGA